MDTKLKTVSDIYVYETNLLVWQTVVAVVAVVDADYDKVAL